MPTEGPYLWAAMDSKPGDAVYLWSDLTDYIRDEAGGVPYTSRRGRQDVTQKFNTGHGTFVLDNRKLTFEALNTAGPYFGKLVPMKPIQFGLDYPWLPGQCANGDMRRDPLWSVNSNCTVTWVAPVAKSLLKGWVNLVAASTALAAGQTPPVLVPGAKIGATIVASLRATNLSAAPADLRCDVLFFTDAAGTVANGSLTGVAVTFPVNQYGSIRVTGVIPASTQSMRVRATVVNAVNAQTYRFACSVLDYTANPQFGPIITAYSDSWNCTWDVGDNTCVLAVSDGLKALGLSPLTTPLYGKYLATLGAVKWYRLDETVNSQVDTLGLEFKDQVTGLSDAQVWSWPKVPPDPAYRGVGPLAGIAGAAPVDNDLGFSFVGPSSEDGGAIWLPPKVEPNSLHWSVAMWIRSTNGKLPKFINSTAAFGVADRPILSIGAKSDALNRTYLSVWLNAEGYIQAVASRAGTTQGSGQSNIYDGFTGTRTTGQNVVVDTLWHRIWVTYNGTTNTLKVYIDGILDHTETQITATAVNFSAATFNSVCFVGGAYNPAQDDLVGGGVLFLEMDELMFFASEIAAGTITTDYLKAKLVYPIQRSTERVGAVLDNSNWSPTLRNIDTAKGVQVTDLRKPFYQANPLTYIQQVEDTEVGMAYADKQGRITFIDVNTIETSTSVYSTPQVIFGTGVGEVAYELITTSNNDDVLYTRGQASREGGSLQVFDTVQPEADYLVRPISKTNLFLDTDEKAYNVAEYIGALFSRAGTHLKGLTFNPYENETSMAALMLLELGYACEVRLRPVGIPPGTYYSVLCSVQAINVDKSRNKARCTLSLDDIYTQRWMQFGDNFDSYNMGI